MDSYVPCSLELQAYEELWKIAAGNEESLRGDHAVSFFMKSGLDLGSLKVIWTWSSPDPIMNRSQFFTALRYVAMLQNGENLSRGSMTIL